MIKKNTGILFYNSKGEILLQLRDDIPEINWPNHWGCIGGAVEDSETVEEGLIREVQEEIEYTLMDYTYLGMLPLSNVREYHMFVAPLDIDVSDITLHEGQEVGFFDPVNALQLDLTTGTRLFIELYIEKYITVSV
jgi:8-oxo-dGTP pyrophosphatase MutT (NUDIX family)